VSVIAVICLVPLTKSGEFDEGYTFGHYVEGIKVGVLMSVTLFVCTAIVFFRFVYSTFNDIARLLHS